MISESLAIIHDLIRAGMDLVVCAGIVALFAVVISACFGHK